MFWQVANEKQPMSKHPCYDLQSGSAKDAQDSSNSGGLPHKDGHTRLEISDDKDSDVEIIKVTRGRKRQEPQSPAPRMKLEPGPRNKKVEIIEHSPVPCSASAQPMSDKQKVEKVKQGNKEERRGEKHEQKLEFGKRIKRQGPDWVGVQLPKISKNMLRIA